MLQGKIILKTIFFYRTRNEYDEVFEYVKALNKEKQELPRFGHKILLRIYTRYHSKNMQTNRWVWSSNVPIRRAGTKKYIGMIIGNAHELKISDIHPEEFLQTMSLEIVSKIDSVSKYSGVQTTYPMNIKTYQEFKTITSVFNKRYGHGNWRIQGPKKLQSKLKHLALELTTIYKHELQTKYPNGIPVILIVNEVNANISKQLFKVTLKG